MDYNSKLIPDTLWDMPLFTGCAEFKPPTAPFAVAETESRLRQIKNMPSTGDNTPQAIFDGLNEINLWTDKHFTTRMLQNNTSPVARGFQAVNRVKKMLVAGLQRDKYAELTEKAFGQIPPELRNFIPDTCSSFEEALQNIAFALLLLKDRLARESRCTRKAYLKKVYKLVDKSMMFNSTTDIQRLKPVIAWIKDIIELDHAKNRSYLDVGCAVSAGAPGVLYAAGELRKNGLCTEIHGVDVVPPSKEVARETLRKHKIFLYKCNMTLNPTPRKYDILLLANVHRHLDRKLQQRLLTNLAGSTNQSGRIFINWRFDDTNSPCVCLKLTSGRLEIETEKNCV